MRGQNDNGNAPAINLPGVVWAILALLLAVHAAISLGGEPWQTLAVEHFAFIPARFGPSPFPQAVGAKWWSMLTYGLLHADWAHVLTNALWLAVFSVPVEKYFGTLRYLTLLCASIIAGALVSLAVHWGQPIILVGISAGVSGLLAAAIPIMYGRPDELHGGIRPLTPMQILTDKRALTFSLVWMALTFFTASTQYLTGTAFLEQRQIAWDAHLGGFCVGLVFFYVLNASVKRKEVHTLH